MKIHEVCDTDVSSLTSSNPSMGVKARSISFSRATGHIDLLDAQGGIRPCDFRTRIQAAGARDYGEDVAERNMGENGVDVRSAAARRFYEQKKKSDAVDARIAIVPALEADQFTFGGSTCGGGSEPEEVNCADDGASISKSLSAVPVQTEPEKLGTTTGRTASNRAKSWHAKTFAAAFSAAAASQDRMSRREQFDFALEKPAPRSTSLDRSRECSLDRKFWISAARPASLSRNVEPESRDRSMSPPNVPRYRVNHDADSITTPKSPCPTGTEPTSVSEVSFDSDIDPACISDDDVSEYGVSIPAAVPIRTARPRLIAVAPPHSSIEWQSAVRTAVEESVANLPASTDLKALLEFSRHGLSLSDISDQVPRRYSSLKQGYLSCSSTPTTMTSGYASSTTGRPHSRQTTATSIDFSTRLDTPSKTGCGSSSDGRGSSAEHRHSSCTLSVSGDDTLIDGHVSADTSSSEAETSRAGFHTTCQSYGRAQPHDLESITTSDMSDADSFTNEKRPTKGEDEALLFSEDKFADTGSLPGLNAAAVANNCMICHVVANLQGTPVPTVACDHNGTTTRKQRLRALGYDYDSDESDSEAVTTVVTSPTRSRTKWLTGGVNGGLRRLKLVDDCIEEASDEERGGGDDEGHHHHRPPRHEVRRKHRFLELRTASSSVAAREEGDFADAE